MKLRIGSGTVAHETRHDNARTLCQRDASDGTPATDDMRACKPCAVVAETMARHQADSNGARANVATVRDYAESRSADHKRIVARIGADDSAATAKAEMISVGTAFADRASMVTSLNGAVHTVSPGTASNNYQSTVTVSPTIGRGALRVPMSHAWADAWDYVAETTMGNAYAAGIIGHARTNLATLPFILFRNDLDDTLQVARARAVDTLISALSAPDTVRHPIGHDCPNTSHPCGADAATLADGTVGITYMRAVRCESCDGCDATTDNRYLTRDCESPIMAAEHVGLRAFTARGLRFAYSRAISRGGARRESFGDTTDYLTATESADPSDASADLSAYGEDLARIIETVGPATVVAGVDIIGRNGRMSDDVLTMLAISVGNYTVTDGEISVSANQRRTALDKIRDMHVTPAPDGSTHKMSGDTVCLCRWDKSTRRIARVCDAHASSGLSRTWRRALEWSVVGRFATDHNVSGRGIGTMSADVFGTMTLDRTSAPPVALPDGEPVAPMVRTATDADRARHNARHAVRSPF